VLSRSRRAGLCSLQPAVPLSLIWALELGFQSIEGRELRGFRDGGGNGHRFADVIFLPQH